LTDGIILLDKPAGQTSFQSLGTLKKRLGTRKVGHAGTLDKFAEGLLVVLAGRMTRLCAFAATLDKEYIASITFGRGTDTLDPEGAVTANGPVPALGELDALLPKMVGESLQVPPAFSALHVGGRRAYEAARAGEALEMAPRRVTITALDLLGYEPPVARVRVACSKGTYVRSLARDIAAGLGTCAFVSALQRTRVGGFSVSDARHPEDFDPAVDVLPASRFFDAAASFRRVTLRKEAVRRASNGLPATPEFFDAPPEDDGVFAAFAPDGALVAVMERKGEVWRYAAVFADGSAAGAAL
jgi:tRNA pseudouridine55 synthase